MSNNNVEIEQTQAWLNQIIIGLNFCPFAKKEVVNQTIHYYVSEESKITLALTELIQQCQHLQKTPSIETTLIIFKKGFTDFNRFLDLVEYANELLIEQGFEGEFQIATFHQNYCFADVDYDDASNFTNRSPYPMLHILREASLEKVLSVYKKPEQIPENNITLAQQKGSQFFQQILQKITQQGKN